jgi:hypothetical protein
LAESYPDAGTRLGSIFSAQDTLIVEQIWTLATTSIQF